jgi:hypothetical protein
MAFRLNAELGILDCPVSQLASERIGAHINISSSCFFSTQHPSAVAVVIIALTENKIKKIQAIVTKVRNHLPSPALLSRSHLIGEDLREGFLLLSLANGKGKTQVDVVFAKND